MRYLGGKSRTRNQIAAYYEQDNITIYHGDCLEIMPHLEPASFDLCFVDWPYYKVKNEPWDRQWDNPEKFLDWIGQTLEQAQRLLKPNGSLYGCASPDMATRVEGRIKQYFNPLNIVRWYKKDSTLNRMDISTLRSYLRPWEAIIFAEQYHSDREAAGESGYQSKSKSLRKKVYSPVFGDYLKAEIERANATRKEIAALFPSATGGLTGCVSNWILGYNCPSKEQYETIRGYLNSRNCNHDYLRQDYEDLRQDYEDLRQDYDYLRQDYEDLRQDYEDLRRPFNSHPKMTFNDLWFFDQVESYPGKHPAEKPIALLEHIITTSTRPGDMVLDFCMGTGTTLRAAANLGRSAVGIDITKRYCDRAIKRVRQLPLFEAEVWDKQQQVNPMLPGLEAVDVAR